MVEEYEKNRANLKNPKDGFREFFEFVGDCPLVGHNVEYDCNIVNSQFAILMKQAQKYYDIEKFKLKKRFDTLKLSYVLEKEICQCTNVQRLRSHKLKDLISILGLAGVNSHKADDDVEATKNLLNWFASRVPALIDKQRAFLMKPAMKYMSNLLRESLLDIYLEHKDLMYMPMPSDDEAILVQVLRQFIEALPNHSINTDYGDEVSKQLKDQVENLQKKLPIIYRYLDRVLIDKSLNNTLYAQLHAYTVAINTLKEPDLCNSEIIDDNVFIATVHKAKGLEFENVIVMEVNDGVYPFFLSQSDEAKIEDARKLYVALSRAKKTLALFYSRVNPWGYPILKSNLINCIKADFEN